MSEQQKGNLNRELMASILRSNMCSYVGKQLTVELMDEMSIKIIESIEYFMNREDKRN